MSNGAVALWGGGPVDWKAKVAVVITTIAAYTGHPRQLLRTILYVVYDHNGPLTLAVC